MGVTVDYLRVNWPYLLHHWFYLFRHAAAVVRFINLKYWLHRSKCFDFRTVHVGSSQCDLEKAFGVHVF